ncbi:MAG TPA: hypothetical protein VLL25_15930 [Acidimicrobiales bacterium]|nr:hypothetical protein [Acidimicrobiales bacterium]
MSRIWYCAHCGYEVDRGGRCHNCKEPLISSPLDELAEGEVDDEVGYRLGDWDDLTRGGLIESLVDNGIRHRFEGDELVVGAGDEHAVDRLIADLSGAGSGSPSASADRELDSKSRVAIGGLYDAAQRLRADPTDMIADGDLAESSARVLALDHLYGGDRETWAAVGRVSRRLLGALGAEEAMEEEIGNQAAVLCRLLDPIVAELHRDDGHEQQELEDGVEADAADDDELIYELPDWLPEERAQLGLLLERDRIPYGWEGSDLIIGEVNEAKVEALFDEVERAPSGGLPAAPEGTDDEEDYQALSDLFGAADRLAGDPEDKRKRSEVSETAAAVVEWSTPVGMSDDQWWQIRTRARAISESIERDADPDAVAESAATLRNLLRQFV